VKSKNTGLRWVARKRYFSRNWMSWYAKTGSWAISKLTIIQQSLLNRPRNIKVTENHKCCLEQGTRNVRNELHFTRIWAAFHQNISKPKSRNIMNEIMPPAWFYSGHRRYLLSKRKYNICQSRKPTGKGNPPLGCVESLARVTAPETGWGSDELICEEQTYTIVQKCTTLYQNWWGPEGTRRWGQTGRAA